MANVYAIASGNWSNTAIWNTGALPTSADDVWANTFTVAADTTTTVLSIRNGSTTNVTAGGGFTAVNGVTLTLTGSGVVAGATGSTNCFASSLTTGQSCTITGNVTAGTSSSSVGVNNLSSGTLNIIGNTTGGSGSVSGAVGAVNTSTGTLNITGTVTGTGAGSNLYGASNVTTGTLNITGNVVGGSAAQGAINSSTGSLNITGSVTGSSVSGCSNTSTGNLTITGSIIASATVSGLAAGGASQNTFLTGPFIGSAQGVAANVALRWRWVASVGSSYMTVPNSTATGYKNLYTADSTLSESGQPATSNVRSGTVYGPNSELTGTCAVPAAGSVALGVPVDNTTGTAILTQQNVTDALTAASAVTLNQQTSSLTTSGSIGERLKLASTVATTAQQLSDALSNE